VGASADSSPEDPAGLAPSVQIRTRSTTAGRPKAATGTSQMLDRSGSMQSVKTDIEGGLADEG
jgi:hypothetical protein